MSGTSERELEETASDYAAYVNLPMDSELKGINESIEEMQLRLEEFNSILGMIQANSSKSITENVPRFLELQPHLNNLCKRIDALEDFVAKANVDLASLEANLELAEASIGSSDSKLAKLNPLTYFKKSPEPQLSSAPPQVLPQQAVNIFKTENYFNTETTE